MLKHLQINVKTINQKMKFRTKFSTFCFLKILGFKTLKQKSKSKYFWDSS